MKILITGANGQLGSEIKNLAVDYPHLEFIFSDLPELNICKKDLLSQFIKENNINGIINCAAYTAVDKAEEEVENANAVNAIAVANLVTVAEEQQLKLIHISTDYVFDGTSHVPYTENMPVSPIGVYGKTKRAGELEIIQSSIEAIIIRTSWLYSSYGNNFVKTIMRLGNERDELGIIFDQVGTPTYAYDLAKVCLDIFAQPKQLNDKSKIYHYSNEGVCSWYDFAKEIIEMGKIQCAIKPIETKDYPTKAQRPNYSVLNKSKIKTDFDIQIPYWKESLKKCIRKLTAAE